MKIGNAKINGTPEQIVAFHDKCRALPTNPQRRVASLAKVGKSVLQQEPRRYYPGKEAVRTYYLNQDNELCYVEEVFSHYNSARAAFDRIAVGGAFHGGGAFRVERLSGVYVQDAKGEALLGETARLVKFPSQSNCIGA